MRIMGLCEEASGWADISGSSKRGRNLLLSTLGVGRDLLRWIFSLDINISRQQTWNFLFVVKLLTFEQEPKCKEAR